MELNMNNSTTSASDIQLIRSLQFVIFSAVILSLVQLIFNRSLWLDEASLALNIVNRSYSDLLKPLSYDQAAPIGFLYIEKFFANLLSNTDFSLRIFPYITYLLSIPLTIKLAFRISDSKMLSLLAGAMLSLNHQIITYSSEAKQYSTDILVVLLLINAALALSDNFNLRRLIVYTFISVVAIWMSNIAVLMIFVMGIYLLYTQLIQKKNYLTLIPILASMVSFIIYYILFIHNHPLEEYMRNYWRPTFMPLNPFTYEFYWFFLKSWGEFYYKNFTHGFFGVIPLLVSLFGLILLFKKKQWLWLFLIVVPTLLHAALSGMELYPFYVRFLLYLIPIYTILYAFSVNQIFIKLQQKYSKLPKLLMLMPIFIFALPYTFKFPHQQEEIKPVLQYLNNNINKKDKIYLYYSSFRAYEFYKVNYSNLQNKEYIIGTIHRENFEEYMPEVTSYLPNLWIVFSHVYPNKTENNEMNYIINSLTHRGYIVQKQYNAKGAAVYYITK